MHKAVLDALRAAGLTPRPVSGVPGPCLAWTRHDVRHAYYVVAGWVPGGPAVDQEEAVELLGHPAPDAFFASPEEAVQALARVLSGRTRWWR